MSLFGPYCFGVFSDGGCVGVVDFMLAVTVVIYVVVVVAAAEVESVVFDIFVYFIVIFR